MKRIFGCLISFLILSSNTAFALPSSDASARSTLDGIPIETVEELPGIRAHEIRLGVGLFPFNAYYNGVTVDGGYTYRFSNDWAWEVANFSQAFTVDKGLTAELANKYHVNPDQIERLRFLASTAAVYTLANGKMLLLKDSIRSFRASLLLGPGLVATDANNYLAASYGLKLEFFNSEAFALKFDIRDSLTFSNTRNYVTFSIGSGIRF